MSHTQADWRCEYLGNGETRIFSVWENEDDIAEICIVAGGLGSSVEDGYDYESFANARLIAAAPDLLEAGQLVIDRWCEGDLAEAVRMLDAAIKKAREGDEPVQS